MVTAGGLFAQGTVYFSNFGGGKVYDAATGGLANGAQVELYSSDSATGTFQAVAGSLLDVDDSVWGAGTYATFDPLTLPNVAGGADAYFIIKAWLVAAPGNVGESAVFSTTAGGPNPTPPKDLDALVPDVTIPVPEPSAIALGVLGAGALLLLRRRK